MGTRRWTRLDWAGLDWDGLVWDGGESSRVNMAADFSAACCSLPVKYSSLDGSDGMNDSWRSL